MGFFNGKISPTFGQIITDIFSFEKIWITGLEIVRRSRCFQIPILRNFTPNKDLLFTGKGRSNNASRGSVLFLEASLGQTLEMIKVDILPSEGTKVIETLSFLH